MRVSGSARVPAPRREVWRRLRDPDALRGALPGCRSLELRGDGVAEVTATTGVAGTHGTYDAGVRLTEAIEPVRCRVSIDAAGDPGTVRADVVVELDEDGDHTVVRYEVDAVVDGRLAHVGRGVLAGAARRVAAEFAAGLGRATIAGDAGPATAGERDRIEVDVEAAAAAAFAAVDTAAEDGASGSSPDDIQPGRRRRAAASAAVGAIVAIVVGTVLRLRSAGRRGSRRGGR